MAQEKPTVEPLSLQHQSTMLTIKFVGCIAIMGIASMGLSLAFVLWKNEQRELAVVTALIATIGNAVSLAIGVLIPSPLQQNQNQNRSRAGDEAKVGPKSDEPTGAAGDPVHVTADKTAAPTNDPSVIAVDPENLIADLTKTPAAEGIEEILVPDESEFKVDEPFPRGLADTLDSSYEDDDEEAA